MSGILNLYNKEKEKNLKLREVISNLNNNWVSKHKIKEKIKELENKQEINRKKLAKAIDIFNFKSIDNISDNMTIIMCVEDILEKLLEE